MSDDYIHDKLKAALQTMHDQGYTKGRVDAVKALATSLTFVYDIGILSAEEKVGYKIALETINATLTILQQDKEESGS